MGNSRNDDLREFARKNHFSYTPICFEKHTKLERALASGEVDAILTGSLRQLNAEILTELLHLRGAREKSARAEHSHYRHDGECLCRRCGTQFGRGQGSSAEKSGEGYKKAQKITPSVVEGAGYKF